MREKARIYGDLKNFQHAASQAEKMRETFQQKMKEARFYVVTGTTPSAPEE